MCLNGAEDSSSHLHKCILWSHRVAKVLLVPYSSQQREELVAGAWWIQLPAWLSCHSCPPYSPHLFHHIRIFLPFISSCFSFAAPSECLMNPGLANRLNSPLRKQALAFIFLCGFESARIKVILARFVWISMKTSNPLLCNIPYFNNFNNYCFPFLIKSLETETLERDQKQWHLVLWRMGRNICIAESIFRAS